ncbi:MAG: hypothetical protein AAFV53_20700 [Myxococcota bacterium]
MKKPPLDPLRYTPASVRLEKELGGVRAWMPPTSYNHTLRSLFLGGAMLAYGAWILGLILGLGAIGPQLSGPVLLTALVLFGGLSILPAPAIVLLEGRWFETQARIQIDQRMLRIVHGFRQPIALSLDTIQDVQLELDRAGTHGTLRLQTTDGVVRILAGHGRTELTWLLNLIRHDASQRQAQLTAAGADLSTPARPPAQLTEMMDR